VVVDGAFYRVGPDGHPYRAGQTPDGELAVETDGDPDAALDDLRFRLGGGLPAEPLIRLTERIPVVAEQYARMPGYRPPMTPEPFEALVSAIAAQQVNLRWATTTRRRLVERFGRPTAHGRVTVWEFPPPAALADARVEDLRELQFTTAKSGYLLALAEAAAGGVLDGLAELSSEAVIERVTAIRGIGRWSSEWLLARCLARPDAIAAGDLGVRKAVAWYVIGVEEVVPEEEVRAATADWGDGGNWATHLLLERLAGR
jgi:DNA-3-methyladenine glycosylase II